MIIKFCLVFPKIFLLHKVVRDAKKVEKHCDRAFSKLFGRNFNPQFFRCGSWFEAFIYLLIGDGGCFLLKGRYFYIKVAVWGLLKA